MATTCSASAREAGEPLAGTAPTATGWLLVESPGAWARDALASARLPAEVTARLRARADAAGVRPLLLREVGHHPAPSNGPADAAQRRRVLLAHPGPTPWMEAVEVDGPHDLDAIDPALAAQPEPPGIGSPVTTPLLAVCTHARRDRCCATIGRPIAAALAARYPGEVRESSHLGGHRFAGVLLALPHGLVFGGLDVHGAVEVVGALRAGHIDAARLRGRTWLAPAAQAAEVAVRLRTGLTGLDDVVVVELEQSDDHARARVALPDGELMVELAQVTTGEARPVSCGAAPQLPTGWRAEVVASG